MDVPVVHLLTGNVMKWSFRNYMQRHHPPTTSLNVVRRQLRQSSSSLMSRSLSFWTSTTPPFSSSSPSWSWHQAWRSSIELHPQSIFGTVSNIINETPAQSKWIRFITTRTSTSKKRYRYRHRCRPLHLVEITAADFSMTSNPRDTEDNEQPKERRTSSFASKIDRPYHHGCDVKNRNNDSAHSMKDDDKDHQRRWKEWKGHWWQQLQSIPNWISMARICATPVLSYWIVTDQPTYAVVGCTIAAISDFLDGWLAKRWNMETVLGTYLDPLADKVIINGLSIAIWYSGTLPTPIVAVWLVKDIALMVATYEHVVNAPSTSTYNNDHRVRKSQLGEKPSSNSRDWSATFALTKSNRMELLEKLDPLRVSLKVKPTRTSKVNTALQFATLGMAIVHPLYNLDPYLSYLSWTTAGTTILALFSYIGYRGLAEIGALPPPSHVTAGQEDHGGQGGQCRAQSSVDRASGETKPFTAGNIRIPLPRSPIILQKDGDKKPLDKQQ